PGTGCRGRGGRVRRGLALLDVDPRRANSLPEEQTPRIGLKPLRAADQPVGLGKLAREPAEIIDLETPLIAGDARAKSDRIVQRCERVEFFAAHHLLARGHGIVDVYATRRPTRWSARYRAPE